MAKVVLITGASAGIGQACADRLDQKGWTVVGASRRGSSSGRWAPMVMDVDSDASVHQAVAAVLGAHSRLDAVVASAGWGLAGPRPGGCSSVWSSRRCSPMPTGAGCTIG